ELLALGERMGTVSTPLSEDELSKCLKRRIHRETSSDDDLNAKCSICQEEYEAEDVIGILSDCGHGYHEACIGQWLRLKNWCPICKASAKQL
ncbi:pspzf zinc finger protein-like protein, partial [Genlisea aurea]